jgi:hypothetical protein
MVAGLSPVFAISTGSALGILSTRTITVLIQTLTRQLAHLTKQFFTNERLHGCKGVARYGPQCQVLVQVNGVPPDDFRLAIFDY